MNEYKISDTEYTAEWIGNSETSRSCSNCGEVISVPYQEAHAKLGNFCPRCGFKMANPGYINIEFDYDD